MSGSTCPAQSRAARGEGSLPAFLAATFSVLLSAGVVSGQVRPDPLPTSEGTPEVSDSEVEPTIIPGVEPFNEPDLPTSKGTPSSQEPVVETLSATGQPREIRPTPRRFHYHIAFDARASYDDNITLAEEDKVDGTFLRFRAVLTLGLGDIEERQENYVRLDYTPSAFLYLNNSDFNTVDHLVRLEGYHRFRRLAVTFSQDIQSAQSSSIETVSTSGSFINDPNIDAGGRRRLTSYASRVNFGYDFSGKTTLSAGATYMTTDYDQLINSQMLAGTLAIDYRYDPKLTIGLAGTVGRNAVDEPSPDQTFEQLNVRGTFELTGKMQVHASAGIELRQSEGGTEDNLSPVFDLGLSYQPFDGTNVDLTASRQTMNSSTLAGQDFSSTQFVATLRQRLFRRFSVGISGGYQNLSYFNTVDGESTAREDNYFFVQSSLDVTLTRFWSAGVYYLHRVNDSSLNSFGFDENQVGFHTGVRF